MGDVIRLNSRGNGDQHALSLGALRRLTGMGPGEFAAAVADEGGVPLPASVYMAYEEGEPPPAIILSAARRVAARAADNAAARAMLRQPGTPAVPPQKQAITLLMKDGARAAAMAAGESFLTWQAPAPLSSAVGRSYGQMVLSEATARDVIEWIESTNTSEDKISYLAHEVRRAAEEHASAPPAVMLTKVQQLHGMLQALLRGGKQRYRQAAELMKLDSEVLAHLCQLLGDLHRDRTAFAYAQAAVVLADEVGASSGAAFSAQSQIARWRGRYGEAADLAAEGFRSSPPAALRALLAYQEADAAAAGGQAQRARLALDRGDAIEDGAVYSAWACPPARRALFRMGVAMNVGDPRDAIRQATASQSMWETERAKAFGTWAHFQIAAAKAHILADSTDGAIYQLRPLLDLPPEYRISTLISHIGTVDHLLRQPRYEKSRQLTGLSEQLRQFTRNNPKQETEGV